MNQPKTSQTDTERTQTSANVPTRHLERTLADAGEELFGVCVLIDEIIGRYNRHDAVECRFVSELIDLRKAVVKRYSEVNLQAAGGDEFLPAFIDTSFHACRAEEWNK